jgi:hypothetical protein
MIEIYCAQGSPEWLKARAGVITASDFNLCRIANGAPPTEYQKDHAFGKAVERITGEPLNDGHTGWAADRGHRLEPEARMTHELELQIVVQQVGLMLTDDRMFGASADGLIGRDGGAEYKCFISPAKLRRIIIDHDFSAIEEQAQGGMWITGRKWWDMCLYCPALEVVGKHFTRHRVKRDDNFIDDMVDDLIRFKLLIDKYERELRESDDFLTACRQDIDLPAF